MGCICSSELFSLSHKQLNIYHGKYLKLQECSFAFSWQRVSSGLLLVPTSAISCVLLTKVVNSGSRGRSIPTWNAYASALHPPAWPPAHRTQQILPFHTLQFIAEMRTHIFFSSRQGLYFLTVPHFLRFSILSSWNCIIKKPKSFPNCVI